MNERDIFLAALEQPTAEARSEYLSLACAGDPTLRHRVDGLLQMHEKTGEFLQKPLVERLAEGVAALEDAADTAGDPSASLKRSGELAFLSPSDQPGSLGRLGHYEVQEVIGSGGMGIVLRAFDERLHRAVAIKVMAAPLAMNAAARKRFQREARAAAAVCHDHIVTIHAVEESDEVPYLVMQCVSGLSLQQRIDRDGPLELHEILRIGMQTAAGLAAAHAQGLIHRDIKPANILLENGVERVKITDFGLARAAADASISQSGAVIGTPQYMAPEQARGEALDGRTDLFSLGSVLYAMCTGRAPFRATSSIAVLKRVCEEVPSPIREANADIPDWLVTIIDKLHAKNPDDRYQSAAEVAEVLGQRLAQLQNSTALPPAVLLASGGRKPPDSAARHKRRWAFAAAAVLVLAATLGLAEGTGATKFTATVIRLLTPEGTLVVEVTDPGVKVTIDGDGGLVITGVGQHKVRLKPGLHKLLADKNGQKVPLTQELVTITRGDKTPVVRVSLESAAAPAVVAPKTEQGAFVQLAAGKERKFDTLAEAVLIANDGDTIEIRGNGPFVSKPVTISNRRALTIRARAGVRPVLRLGGGTVEDQTYLLNTNGPLVLEGLEIVCERSNPATFLAAIVASESRLQVANCRFVAPFRQCLYIPDCRLAVVTNCEFLGSSMDFSALAGHQAQGGVWKLDNCVQIGGAAVSCGGVSQDVREGTVQIRRCSLVGCMPLFFYFFAIPKDSDSGRAARMVLAEVSGCLLDNEEQVTGAIWHPESMNQAHTPPAVKPEECFRHLIQWRGSDNVFPRAGNSSAGPETGLIHLLPGKQDEWVPGVRDLATWRKFWDSPETGTLTGMVRYGGGDLVRRSTDGAEKLSPEDFRLRPDSAGYKAGKDGKDLGADIDLVGPGRAYERWKKTPEYEEWLKETGQKSKESGVRDQESESKRIQSDP